MWRIEWFENNEKQESLIGDSIIDLETELLRLEDSGINTNQIKVYAPNGDKMNYLEAMELSFKERD